MSCPVFHVHELVKANTGEIGTILSAHGGYYRILLKFESRVVEIYATDLQLWNGGSVNGVK